MNVVNLRSWQGDIARFLREVPNAVYVGRPTALSNVFTWQRTPYEHVLVANRSEALDACKRWLWACLNARRSVEAIAFGKTIEVEIEPTRAAAVRCDLMHLDDDAVLGCFCSPRKCHGDIVVRAAKWIRGRRLQPADVRRSSCDEFSI